jgi:hypothetical protein
MGQEIEERPGAEPSAGASWATVLQISVVELIVLMVLVQIAFGFEAPLAFFAVALAAGLVVFKRQGRPGTVALLVVGVIFVVANIPFVVPSLLALNSPVEFILNLLFLLGGFGTIIAGSNLVRGNEGVRSSAPKRWLQASAGIAVVLAAVSIVVKLTDEKATPERGDIKLVAQDTKWSNDRLISGQGKIGVYIENKDIFSHTFVIDELKVKLVLPGSSQKRTEFEAGPGEYEFKCTIPGHDEMKGTIVVS